MYHIFKRAFDIFVSSLALLFLSPVLLAICIILMLTGEHEVFYFQERIGYKGKNFYIWKFATMLKNSPNMGTGALTVRNDTRVLPFGRFLRKTKLNELPQLVNVLKGDMSIVGPRPLVEKTFYSFLEAIQIYDSYPGLSGVGSIVFRDEEDYISRAKDPKLFYFECIQPYKAELELWYLKHKSLRVDIMIILLTLGKIISKNNDMMFKVFKTLPKRDMEKELYDFNQHYQ